jgi:hypothetical protein
MKNKNLSLFILVASIVIATALSSFFSGYYLQQIIQPSTTSPLPYPSNTEDPKETYTFSPDKHYFSDTVFVINKEKPHQSLIATIARGENETSYIQNTRVSYFNGKTWTRELENQNTRSASIFTDRIVKKWNNSIDPSRVLKEKLQGEIALREGIIEFSTEDMFNEMGMRSMPGYTKFQSHTNGNIKINNQSYDAYVLFTRIYSLNAADIQFYDKPLGVTTEWIAFWDEQDNFYHIDKTNVQNKTEIYQSHEIGLKVDKFNTVRKSMNIISSRDNNSDPKEFSFTFGPPIDDKLEVKRINVHNKAPNNSYVWQMAQVEGKILTSNGQEISGFGISEYIKD